ncbi:hypothetical protein MKW92_039371 [Papaver armeniacum]|nr:hypothetical protein MKW92_039371 [Papaver armeniacum]
MEARARRSDPVHGLAGIAKNLPQKLDNLTSQLASVNHQIQFHRLHSVVQQEQRQCRLNGAKGASSSPLREAVPSVGSDRSDETDELPKSPQQ